MAVPEEIKACCPDEFGAVEIQKRGDHFYVYRVTSKWSKEKGRSEKVTGECVGKIVPGDGFVVNKNGMIFRDKHRAPLPDARPHVRNYGAYETIRQLSPDMDERLKEYFPDLFREVRTVALLRLIDGVSSAKAVRPAFLSSYLSNQSPDIATGETSVRNLVDKVGRRQDDCEAFMKSTILPGTKLLFDGTSIFTDSKDSLAAKGYNPDHSTETQARLLYVFERDTAKPVFYRVLQGSVVDKTALIDTVNDSGCKDCIIIADKGFYSKKNLSALMGAGMRFILPLQDNTAEVDKSFYEDPDDRKFDDIFYYNGRPIWCKKTKSGNRGNFIYTFRDDARGSEQRARFVAKAENDYDEGEKVPMDVVDEKRLGYFSFCSNLDVTSKELYMEYKRRVDIEQCFDYLKTSVSPKASNAHTDDYFRGWAFLNHVSMLYYYGLINAIRAHKDKLKGISADDVIRQTKNIYLVDYGLGHRVSSVQQGTQDILDTLGVDLLRKN